MADRLVNADWVRERFGAGSNESVWRWARLGLVPSVRIGRRVFFDPGRIEEIIEAGGAPGEHAPSEAGDARA